jgi:hypothetical protein
MDGFCRDFGFSTDDFLSRSTALSSLIRGRLPLGLLSRMGMLTLRKLGIGRALNGSVPVVASVVVRDLEVPT